MKTLIINNNSKKIGALELLISEYSDAITIRHFDVIEESDKDSFDLIVISGGSNMAIPRNREKLTKEVELIKNTTKPLIGVCLGFELIADTFGAELLYRTEKVSGIIEIEPTQDHEMFKNKKKFSVYESHKYYIEKVTDVLKSLAHGAYGIEIIEHRTRPIWGMQFHPEEIRQKNDGGELFRNLIAYIHEKDLVQK